MEWKIRRWPRAGPGVKYESCLSRGFFQPLIWGALRALFDFRVCALFVVWRRKQSVIFKPKQCSSLNPRMKQLAAAICSNRYHRSRV